MQLLLIDGTYELFRGHFGALRRGGSQPFPAASGLFRQLVRWLREPGVTHVACAFDNPIESFRNELLADYKTSDGVEPKLLAQFDLAEQVSRALGIVTWPMREFEADDALATAAARWGTHAEITRVVIASPDKDLLQCVVEDRVVTSDSVRQRVYDAQAVREKYGVPPATIPDLLALVGDAADGIAGVPGWGLKSAAHALDLFGALEAIPRRPEAWPQRPRGLEARLDSLVQHEREVALYKQLTTLRRDVPLAEALEDLRYAGPKERQLAQVCEILADDEVTALAAQRSAPMVHPPS